MSTLRRGGLGVAFLGSVILAWGCWLPAKAGLAGILLRAAWGRTLDSGESTRPWPWAETWPVSRLRVPDLGIDTIVLAGAEGASLAFAPGHVDGTARPGEPGNVAIGGHRDTTFAFLGDLRRGHRILLESPSGEVSVYHVTGSEVVRHDEIRVLRPNLVSTLTLITCYPLDGTVPGTEWRYVVVAKKERSPRSTALNRQ